MLVFASPPGSCHPNPQGSFESFPQQESNEEDLDHSSGTFHGQILGDLHFLSVSGV